MKKTNLKLLLCCSTLLVVPQLVLAQTSTAPASCKSSDCAALGYSRSNVDYCAEYIKCPFDPSYKVCLHNCSDTYIETAEKVAALVVENTDADITASQVLADLDGSLTSKWGYDSLGLVALIKAIEDAFNVEISSDDAARIKTVNDIIHYLGATCKEYPLSSCPTGANCASQYAIVSCRSGYTLNAANTACTSSSSGSTTTCATGEYTTASMAKSNCTPYGYTKNSTTGCYKCCTINNASSCTNACTVTSCPTGGSCVTSSGTTVITGCKIGYTATTNSTTKCVTKCTRELIVTPTTCTDPYFSPTETGTKGCNCTLGYTGVTVGTEKCYRCCTASDTPCLKCHAGLKEL